MKTIKKTLVLLMLAIGFILILGDADEMGWSFFLVKIIGISLFLFGLQLCCWWRLFSDYLDED